MDQAQNEIPYMEEFDFDAETVVMDDDVAQIEDFDFDDAVTEVGDMEDVDWVELRTTSLIGG